jgi:hypothetical protein
LPPGLRARNPGTVTVTRRRVAGCRQPGLRLLQARATCGPSATLRVAVAFALCWQALRLVAHGVWARSYGTHGLHPKLSSLMPVQYAHIPQAACGVQVGENMRTQVVHPTALAALMRGAAHDSGCVAQRPRGRLFRKAWPLATYITSAIIVAYLNTHRRTAVAPPASCDFQRHDRHV